MMERFGIYPNLSSMFGYTEDGSRWISAGSSVNTAYLTWKIPEFSRFDEEAGVERLTMKVQAAFNGRKNCILESLLKLTCEPSNGAGAKYNQPVGTSSVEVLNTEEILDLIFGVFKPLHLNRAREGTSYLDTDLTSSGLGYWRNDSSLVAAFAGTAFERGVRSLLRGGDARCGEFCGLLFHMSLCHGIALKHFAILSAIHAGYNHPLTSPKYANAAFLVKGWTINDPQPPLENSTQRNKAQGNRTPLHFFWDHVFSVYQVGQNFKYYDPSYGLTSASFIQGPRPMLNDYAARALEGILYVKRDTTGMPFLDISHTQQPINLLTQQRGVLPALYDTVQNNHAQHLLTVIQEANTNNPPVVDRNITITK